ncbi:hypothetical protein E4U17_006555 [Claviceps sp. LM77 group G4]|nr:hypothetical protein E4U17_006555 [Claviceps sp. LM77 group G4]KAG6068155.1 hypothetical protein E4U33_005118 [Claviceps sp. LM78 group G4]
MDANTNPGTQLGLRQPDFATVAEISRVFAEQMDRCRNLPAVQDGAQWAELSVRMGAFEGKLENLDSKVQNLDSKVQNLDTKVQNLDAKVQILDTKLQNLDTKVQNIDANIRNLETNITLIMTKLDDIIAARSTEMDEKFARCNHKIDAV